MMFLLQKYYNFVKPLKSHSFKYINNCLKKKFNFNRTIAHVRILFIFATELLNIIQHEGIIS